MSPAQEIGKLLEQAGVLAEVSLVIPEYDQHRHCFRAPNLRDSVRAVAEGSRRLLICTVFRQSSLMDLQYSEIIGERFARVVVLPCTKQELQRDALTLADCCPVSEADKDRYKRRWLNEWCNRLLLQVDHRLKAVRVALRMAAESCGGSEPVRIGKHAKESLYRGVDEIEAFRRDIAGIDRTVANAVAEIEAGLRAMCRVEEVRELLRQFAILDEKFAKLRTIAPVTV